MKYAKFNEKGEFQHILIDGVHSIPSDAVRVSDRQVKAIANEQDGVWKLIDGKIIKTELPKPSFESLKEAKLQLINAAFTTASAALTEGYPEAERMTWPTQQAEVLAWAEDPEAPTPYLDGLAAARGISSQEMRQKTLDQTQLFMQASQQLVGTRQRLRDLVYEAQTPEELDAISWPEPTPT